MQLSELVKGLDIVDYNGNPDVEIQGIAYDSRKARKEFLFVCIDGTRVDGHKYIRELLKMAQPHFCWKKRLMFRRVLLLSELKTQDMVWHMFPTGFLDIRPKR